MSRPGDVVWSDGRSWQRGIYGSARGATAWWVNPAVGTATLEELLQADDFRWMVNHGKRVVNADDCPPQAAHEAYTFDQLADMTEMRNDLAQRLGAEISNRENAEWQLAQALARSSEIAADLVESERQHDQARRELAAMTNQRDVAENRYADALAGQLSRAALEERAAIVAWLRRYNLTSRNIEHGLLHIANSIESGEHLAGDDE